MNNSPSGVQAPSIAQYLRKAGAAGLSRLTAVSAALPSRSSLGQYLRKAIGPLGLSRLAATRAPQTGVRVQAPSRSGPVGIARPVVADTPQLTQQEFMTLCFGNLGIKIEEVKGKTPSQIHALMDHKIRLLANEQVQSIGFPLR